MSTTPMPTKAAPWPPPPDLDSLKDLIAQADVEGFIAKGAPADEYETEAEELHMAIETWTTADLTAERLLPTLEEIWAGAFSLDDQGVEARRARLRELAEQIERFFGPGAQPQVRGS